MTAASDRSVGTATRDTRIAPNFDGSQRGEFANKLTDELNRMLVGRGLKASVRPFKQETELEIDIELMLRGPLAEKLIQRAAKVGKTPVDIMAEVIEAVIEDDLFAAVLDT